MAEIEKYVNKIICGDCLKVMKDWDDNCVDLVLTDPPYGVGLGEIKRCQKMSKHPSNGYIFPDTPEYVISVCVPVVKNCINISKRTLVTPGTRNCFKYPEPFTIWCLYWPNGAGIGRWSSFTCWQPVLCYGEPPEKIGCFPDTFVTTEQAERNGHPCPKPLEIWMRLLERCSSENNLILDPFCGSGTTCVAAKMLGRRYIGIDISPEYCKIAEERLRAVDTGVPVKEARAGQKALFE